MAKKLPVCINSDCALLRQNYFLIGNICNVPRPAHSLTLYCSNNIQSAELQNSTLYGTVSFIRFTCIRTSVNLVQLFFLVALRPDFVSWPPLMGLRDHTDWTNHNWWDCSGRRTDLYLKTHNIHDRKASMPPVEFEPTIRASERPQTYVLYRAATGIEI
jgi:hypothetical protein